MKQLQQLQQKLKKQWWKETPGYKKYHLREYSGILIAAWAIFYVCATLLNLHNSPFTFLIHTIGLIGAIIHTSSWLSIMPQLLPIQLNVQQQKITFILLILIWLGVSTILLQFLWT